MRLLGDLRSIFEAEGVHEMASNMLLSRLIELPEAPGAISTASRWINVD